MRWAGWGLLALVSWEVAFGGSSVHATPILHERVEVGVRCRDGLCFDDSLPLASRDETPVAIEQDGERIAAPAPESRNDSPIFSSQTIGEAAADSITSWDPNQKLVYHELFSPSVYPMERGKVFDQISSEEVLSVRDSKKVAIEKTAARATERDAFWGQATVDFKAGAWIAIPSPAAGLHVLYAGTTPPIAGEIRFARDSAENLFVSAAVDGRHTLTWLADTAQTYYAGPISHEIRIGDEPALPPLPPDLLARARIVLERMHLHPTREQSLRSVLDPLVTYFRSFQEGDLPAHSASTYLDLALSRRGVCRHRSFAFMITALAAGIPTRYVQNELHVFVEVWIPNLGWRQINLGGARADASLAGAERRAPYSPKGEDPLPKPSTFGSAQVPRAHFDAQSGSGVGSGAGSGTAERVKLDVLARHNVRSDVVLVPTTISVSIATRSAFRGDSLEAAGRVTANAPDEAGGLSVDLYLEDGDAAVLVGTTTTLTDGTFRATLHLPRDLSVGDHHLIARTPGDVRRSGAMTR